ncbi:hypothetical protein Aca07nite_72290 [Actinoplanes capillaceus]|uniref:Uncharacterized protein n=1 Tax=Actinoplanes campanulatus TaxID=113559 RepID=A0ABQ3WUL7_9ACTN|nr:hypothetical protein [Actinoplanes capillaceus]GID49954.1 hypothetical protein Aca07nite_72290 [Actinoplanes capillaceus]
MSTPTIGTNSIVTVCFAPGEDNDWFSASTKVDDHLQVSGTPARRFRVRHRALIGWLTRFFPYYLLHAVRSLGIVTRAAGGRKSRLDLSGMSATAVNEAIVRWRAWRVHIAATTPVARTWDDFLVLHQQNPRKVSYAEARRRFEQQPRVLAMLSFAGGFTFDPYELALYQAGEATYAGLYWRAALIGDALITTDGRLLQPATDSIADRIRFLTDAVGYLHSLSNRAHLCAVTIV